MRNLPFHNRIMGILLAQQDARRSLSPSEEHERPEWEEVPEEQLSFHESLILGGIGLIRLFPALLIVMGLFVAFVAFLSWIWGL